jgi:hypothetical protein
VLDGALEAVTRLNEQLIRSGESPTSRQLISAGAKWQPEKPGDEHFDHGAKIASRGHGDCDDWAPLHAATLRATGEDPEARAIVRKSGRKRWHAIVERSDGSIEDPSLAAGMPGPATVVGVGGAAVPLMHSPRSSVVGGAYLDMPQLALRPISDRAGQIESWQARADLPWHWLPGASPQDAAMVSLHRSPVSSQAIVGAVLGARDLGLASGNVHPEQLRRLSAIADACEGCPYEQLEESYGRQHAQAASTIVGSFFGKALRKVGKFAKKAVSPLAKGALSFVPGGGLATAAFNAASPSLRKAVLHRQHKPRAQRAVPPPRMQPAPERASPLAVPGGWLPYPYPLPYPVPGWGSDHGAIPGQAWPR